MSPTHDSLSGEATQHLSQLQCSRQWRGFLQALAAEFTQALSNEELRELMFRVGERFACAHLLGPCATLSDLQQRMTDVWCNADWGSVTLVQQKEQLSIIHHCAPLLAGMDKSNIDWSLGFLQGAYQKWFDTAGAGSLRVAPGEPTDAWGSASFSLSR
jgi:hypothetical protein